MVKNSAKKKTSTKKQSANQPSRVSVSVDKDSSVRVREIENGYVISESGTTGKGRNASYYEKEYFSESNPVNISMPSKAAKKAPAFGKKK